MTGAPATPAGLAQRMRARLTNARLTNDLGKPVRAEIIARARQLHTGGAESWRNALSRAHAEARAEREVRA